MSTRLTVFSSIQTMLIRENWTDSYVGATEQLKEVNCSPSYSFI